MTDNRRPIDEQGQRLRRIRHLKNRRDTIIQNILRMQRSGYTHGVEVNREECNKVNCLLVSLGAQ